MADEMMSVTDVYHALKNKPFTSENDGERDEFTVEPPTSGTTYDDDDKKIDTASALTASIKLQQQQPPSPASSADADTMSVAEKNGKSVTRSVANITPPSTTGEEKNFSWRRY